MAYSSLIEKIDRYKFVCTLLSIVTIISVFLNIIFIIDGRSSRKTQENITNILEYINLEEIAHDNGYYVYYDKNTKVMYYQIRYKEGEYVMSPIFNSDGTVKLYEGD